MTDFITYTFDPNQMGMWGAPEPEHTHDRHTPWDGEGYVCEDCPGGHILCESCGKTADRWYADDTRTGFFCPCVDEEKAPDTLKQFPAAPPAQDDICKERYYGIECQCPRKHMLRGSR